MGYITIQINIKHRDKSEVELPDDVQIKHLLPALMDALNINEYSRATLKNESQDFAYNENETLASKKTLPNDHCLLNFSKSRKNTKDKLSGVDSHPKKESTLKKVDIGGLKFVILKEVDCKDDSKSTFLISHYKKLEETHKKLEEDYKHLLYEEKRLLYIEKDFKTQKLIIVISNILIGLGVGIITATNEDIIGGIIFALGFFVSVVSIFNKKFS